MLKTPAPLHENNSTARRSATAALTLAALGIVFGDLGTSPLYALQEAFNRHFPLENNQGG